MTNEEIEKRFLFDLEMEVFTKYMNTYIFITHKRCSYKKIFKFYKLIENIGYKNNVSCINERIPLAIILNKDKKTIIESACLGRDQAEKWTKIPSYINKYSID